MNINGNKVKNVGGRPKISKTEKFWYSNIPDLPFNIYREEQYKYVVDGKMNNYRINIQQNLYDHAKDYAKEHGLSVRSVIRIALVHFLKRNY